MKKFSVFVLVLFTFFGCTSTKPVTEIAEEVQEEFTPQQLIEMGKIEEAKDLFAFKFDINSIDENGNTALHLAAKINDGDLCKFLLIKGIDSSLKNYNSDTALHVAVNNESFEAAKVLTCINDNIYARNGKNETALENALAKNDAFYEIMICAKTGTILDENGQTIIHHFVKNHNEKAVSFAIKKNLPVDEKDFNGITPLAIALNDKENDSSIKNAAELLKAGAKQIDGELSYFEEAVIAHNMSLRRPDGETPLHISASLEHLAVTKYLIANGASVKAQDISGSTPLHYAVRTGNTAIARELLENNADVNALDTLGKTPLMLIIPQEKQFEMYSLLLEKNADTRKRDTYGDSVLHVATLINANTNVLKLLTKCGADPNARNKEGVTPLLMAVQMNCPEHIAFYVRNGADINAYDVNGKSPLTVAFLQNIETVKSLVIKANVDSVDSKGNTPIHTAVLKNATLETFDYIARLCRDIDARNADGNTALYLAIQKNRRDLGELLINMDADLFITNTKNYSPLRLAFTMGGDTSDWIITSKTIEVRDGAGNSAVHYAAEWEEENAIRMLFEKGADMNAKNANGESPLFAAVKTDSNSIIDLLVSCGAKLNSRDNTGSTPLHSAVRWEAYNAATELINQGATVDAQNTSGSTPLSEAALTGKKAMASMLISKGADVNICDSEGRSILINAVRSQNLEMIDLMLKNNASLNLQEMDGRNVSHEAVLTGNVEIIKKIQKAGGDALSRDKSGETPFSLALSKNEDVIRAVAGSNKNLADSDGNTLMHIAVANNAKPVIINVMLSENYPFDTRNAAGYTPLYLAASSGQASAVDALLAGGANPFTSYNKKDECTVTLALQRKDQILLNTILKYASEKTDIQGNTILHYAAKMADAETVRKLLAADINPKIKNIAGETAYDVAKNWQKNEIAELLK